MLYSIQFLHQITTKLRHGIPRWCCIVSNFYIKSQHTCASSDGSKSCIVSNFYIKSQRYMIDMLSIRRCIVSNFYIKSQLALVLRRPDRVV